MRKKLNLFLSVLMLVGAFFINGCGENSDKPVAKKGAAQVSDPAPSAPATFTAEEEKTMNSILAHFLASVTSYGVEHNAFPPTKMEADKYNGKVPDGYEIEYNVTEKEGKVAEFVITVFNPAKTYMVDFKSACHEKANCVEAYNFTSTKKLLADSQIKPVTK